jgi:hypothetical protein
MQFSFNLLSEIFNLVYKVSATTEPTVIVYFFVDFII